MKTFVLDIIPRLQKYSEKLDNLSILQNKHWVMIDQEQGAKIVFIFRQKDNQLLISTNGNVEKGKWDYLGNNSLLIERGEIRQLFKHGFIDDFVLALKVDGKQEYALLVNEEKFKDESLSISFVLTFLDKKYFEEKKKGDITIPLQVESEKTSLFAKEWTLKQFAISKDMAAALALDSFTLKQTLEEIEKYIKRHDSRYPLYAAIKLTERGEELSETQLENLKRICLFYFGSEDLDHVLMQFQKKDIKEKYKLKR